MDWLHPTYFWALIAVPLVIGGFGWAAWQRHRARQRFGDATTIAQLSTAVRPERRRWRGALTTLGALLLVVALAGPRIGTETRTVEQQGIDLMIALDVSQSMTAEDAAPNRLDRAKNTIKRLLDARKGDRVGLILFAGDAFIQCPLTTDFNAVRLFLDAADPSMIATPGTDVHHAFRMGLEAFSSSSLPDTTDPTQPARTRTRALLMVSDGEHHGGAVDGIRSDAEAQNIALFTAGVGTPEGVRIPLYENGRRIGYKRDNRGEVVTTRLDETMLRALPREGTYVRLNAASNPLATLNASLDQLEQTALDTEQFAAYRERYQWPLAGALLLLVGARLIRVRRPVSRSSPSVPASS